MPEAMMITGVWSFFPLFFIFWVFLQVVKVCTSLDGFQETGLGTCSRSPGACSLMLRVLLPPSAPCPCLGSPLFWGSFCFTHLQAMDGVIRDESPDPGHLREVEARGAAPISSCASSHAVLDELPAISHSAGNQGGESVGTCLGREAVLGMEQELQKATLCSEDFRLTH